MTEQKIFNLIGEVSYYAVCVCVCVWGGGGGGGGGLKAKGGGGWFGEKFKINQLCKRIHFLIFIRFFAQTDCKFIC